MRKPLKRDGASPRLGVTFFMKQTNNINSVIVTRTGGRRDNGLVSTGGHRIRCQVIVCKNLSFYSDKSRVSGRPFHSENFPK